MASTTALAPSADSDRQTPSPQEAESCGIDTSAAADSLEAEERRDESAGDRCECLLPAAAGIRPPLSSRAETRSPSLLLMAEAMKPKTETPSTWRKESHVHEERKESHAHEEREPGAPVRAMADGPSTRGCESAETNHRAGHPRGREQRKRETWQPRRHARA